MTDHIQPLERKMKQYCIVSWWPAPKDLFLQGLKEEGTFLLKVTGIDGTHQKDSKELICRDKEAEAQKS